MTRTLPRLRLSRTVAVGALLAPFALGACGVLPVGTDLGGGPDDLAVKAADGGIPGDGAVSSSFASLYSSYLSQCAACHAPAAPGRTYTTEQSLDFSTQKTAYTTLVGAGAAKATGLAGNQTACNGVAFVIAGKPASSLLVAVIDATTRLTFAQGTGMACDATAVSDMVLKTGTEPPAGFIPALEAWITAGALDN